MALPPELEEQFMTDIVAYEERERKPYVTSVERIASQRGIERGAREMLLETLSVRFGTVPEEVETLLERISNPQLFKTLQRLAVTADSLETFEQEVLTHL
jgi:hypothetical protein